MGAEIVEISVKAQAPCKSQGEIPGTVPLPWPSQCLHLHCGI